MPTVFLLGTGLGVVIGWNAHAAIVRRIRDFIIGGKR